MDHMHHIEKENHINWKYPEIADTCKVEIDQILTIRPIGNKESNIYKLSNADLIITHLQNPV